MPATGTLVPDGDGTLLELTPVTASIHFDEVDNTIALADDTDLLSGTGNTTSTDFLDFLDMPGDFDVAVDVTGAMRTEISGIVDDTVTMLFDIFNSAEDTLIEALASLAGNHSLTNTTGSAQANTDNAAAWNGYKMRLQVLRSNSGMPDAIQADFSEVEVVLNYDALAGAPDIPLPSGPVQVPRAKRQAVAYGGGY